MKLLLKNKKSVTFKDRCQNPASLTVSEWRSALTSCHRLNVLHDGVVAGEQSGGGGSEGGREEDSK